jgi:hypothetical protein
MLVATNIQLNNFELALLEYIYRNPGIKSVTAIGKAGVDPGSGPIAIRYMARLGLINAGDGGWSEKKLTATAAGVEMLKENGLKM